MRFLLDENVELRVAAFLVAEGHDVATIGEDYPFALHDEDVLRIAHTEQRVLVTNDRDFGELILKQQHPHSGVIYFRLPLDTGAAEKITRLQQILASYQGDLGSFLVVTSTGIRIR